MKDIIDEAIKKGKHISGREELDSQTWQEFEKVSSDKKVFLFGAGACADYFFRNYGDMCLEGIIDNDSRRQGFCAHDFLGEAIGTRCGGMEISAVDLLKQYDADQIVVLITSTNYYNQIIDDLAKMGVRNSFVLLIMEADKRMKCVCDLQEVKIQDYAEYAQTCCEYQIEPKKIGFYSFGSYADHGKYITEALLALRKDLDIVWFVNDLTVDVPEGVRKIYTGNRKRYIYELETAKVWVFNMIVPHYLIKRSGQIYIQTKHWASITLKRFYLDAATVQDVSDLVDLWKYNSTIIDYIITGSDFDTQSSRRGFAFNKEVWQIGSPRSDALFSGEKYRNKVYGFYRIAPDVRTLIYAPTYRFNKSETGYQHESRGVDLDFEKVKNALEKHFGGTWNILLRLHPSVAEQSVNINKPDFVVDVGNYDDSEELVAACDIMISDYSSIMFEPAFVKKPVFLFAADKNDYIDKEFELLVNYAELPFPIAESNVELEQKILQFQQKEYEERVEAFMKKYGVCEDGHASERAAQLVSDLFC